MVLLPYKAAADVNDQATKLLLHKFNGTILDFDASRIIWKANDKVLWLYNRTDGSQIKVYDGTGSTFIISAAKLSAQGIVYDLNNEPWMDIPYVSLVYSWKNGQTVKIANDDSLYDIRRNGNIVRLGLHTVDLTTGQTRVPGFDRADFLADGSMIYTAPSAPGSAFSLYQSFPDGTVDMLASPSNKLASKWYGSTLGYYGPLSDGKNIVYRELMVKNNYSEMVWALRLRNADQTVTTLSVNPNIIGRYYPNESYRINNGWVAYIEYDKEIKRKVVNVRSPEGTVKRVFESPFWWSWRYAPLSIDELGPDGTVAFTFNDKTYLYYTKANKTVSIQRSPAMFQYREQVLGGPGDSEYRVGAWYLQAKDSLYAVRF